MHVRLRSGGALNRLSICLGTDLTAQQRDSTANRVPARLCDCVSVSAAILLLRAPITSAALLLLRQNRRSPAYRPATLRRRVVQSPSNRFSAVKMRLSAARQLCGTAEFLGVTRSPPIFRPRFRGKQTTAQAKKHRQTRPSEPENSLPATPMSITSPILCSNFAPSSVYI